MSPSVSSPPPIQPPPPPPKAPPLLSHDLSHDHSRDLSRDFKHNTTLQTSLHTSLRTSSHTPLPSLHLDYRRSPSNDGASDRLDRFDRPVTTLPLYPPPSYAQTNDSTGFRFSDPPKTELPPIQSLTAQHDQTKTNGNNYNNPLPSFSTLAASSAPLYSSPQHLSPQPSAPAYSSSAPSSAANPANHWPSLNPLTAYYTPSHAQTGEPPMRMDLDSSSNSGASAASPDRFLDGRASSVSLDDPDVRMAAEALGDLRAG